MSVFILYLISKIKIVGKTATFHIELYISTINSLKQNAS